MRPPIDGPPCPGPGWQLIARIGARVNPVQTHRLKWRWMLGWWDLRRKRRRGTPVA